MPSNVFPNPIWERTWYFLLLSSDSSDANFLEPNFSQIRDSTPLILQIWFNSPPSHIFSEKEKLRNQLILLLFQQTRSRWHLTKCTTRAAQPTALFTVEESQMVRTSINLWYLLYTIGNSVLKRMISTISKLFRKFWHCHLLYCHWLDVANIHGAINNASWCHLTLCQIKFRLIDDLKAT